MDGDGWNTMLDIGNGGGVKILGGRISLANNAMICGTNISKKQTFSKRREYRFQLRFGPIRILKNVRIRFIFYKGDS